MNRRRFVTVSGAAAAASLTSTPVAAATPGRALMKLGCQSAPTTDTHLKYLARYGVRNICGYPQIAGDRIYATVDELKQMRELAEKIKVSATPTVIFPSGRRLSRALTADELNQMLDAEKAKLAGG